MRRRSGAAARRLRSRARSTPSNTIRPRARPVEAEDAARDGRLAAAGLADQREGLAAPDREADAVDRLDPGPPLALQQPLETGGDTSKYRLSPSTSSSGAASGRRSMALDDARHPGGGRIHRPRSSWLNDGSRPSPGCGFCWSMPARRTASRRRRCRRPAAGRGARAGSGRTLRAARVERAARRDRVEPRHAAVDLAQPVAALRRCAGSTASARPCRGGAARR